jgi:hypothetical protein
MCLNCYGVGTEVYHEYPINIKIFENKSIIFVQLKTPTSFKHILQQTKLRKFQNCKFYFNNHEVKMFQVLEKGTHIIHFRSILKGGGKEKLKGLDKQLNTILQEIRNEMGYIQLRLIERTKTRLQRS